MKKGLIHIYTGEGKGKTTASVGLAVRARAHDFKVCYSYFNKKPSLYGTTEVDLLKNLGVIVFGTDAQHPSFNKSVTQESHTKVTNEIFEQLIKFIDNEDFDMLIMDEILISVRDNFIDEKILVDFIKNKPEKLELVLTGRAATDNLINLADYVSNIQLVKHPYQKKIRSREGIEY